MSHTRLVRLIGVVIAVWLLSTLYEAGHAQTATDLPAELRALLQDLQKRPGEPPNAPTSGERLPGAALDNSPPTGGYDDAILRYSNLITLATGVMADHAVTLEQQLQVLEAELTKAISAPGGLQRPEEPQGATQLEHAAGEASEAGHPIELPGRSPSPASEARLQQLADIYTLVTRRLEELAASSREIARQLQDLRQ